MSDEEDAIEIDDTNEQEDDIVDEDMGHDAEGDEEEEEEDAEGEAEDAEGEDDEEEEEEDAATEVDEEEEGGESESDGRSTRFRVSVALTSSLRGELARGNHGGRRGSRTDPCFACERVSTACWITLSSLMYVPMFNRVESAIF